MRAIGNISLVFHLLYLTLLDKDVCSLILRYPKETLLPFDHWMVRSIGDR